MLDLIESGVNDCEVSRRTGVPRTTVHNWRAGNIPAASSPNRCGACGHPEHEFGEMPPSYVYLLGVYLGDGHITSHARGVRRLTISLDSRYQGIVRETQDAVASVVPQNSVLVQANVRGARLTLVSSYSKQWPCLFPQHGPGLKHTRAISLEAWQEALVDERPELFLRGLIHSDGCRSMNRVVVRGKAYSYPRYTFSNASSDIRHLFCDACDRLGIDWRQMNARNISVARRESVKRLDEFVGPKR